MPPGGSDLKMCKPRRVRLSGVSLFFLAVFVKAWYNDDAALPQSGLPGSGKGVDALDFLLDFFVSVGASIIGNYVSKWLDRHRKGQ